MFSAKKSDAKGRIALGATYANQTFLIEEQENGDLILKKAVVVPEKEAWLYANQTAHAQVTKGIAQAAKGQFAPEPMETKENLTWLDEIDD
jgi:hypothetical protein